jgi:hypothetical protein
MFDSTSAIDKVMNGFEKKSIKGDVCWQRFTLSPILEPKIGKLNFKQIIVNVYVKC